MQVSKFTTEIAVGYSLEKKFVSFIKKVQVIKEDVWHSSLTGEDSAKLERIQKTVLSIILADQYLSYSSALQKLSERRSKICLSFAKKSVKNKKFSNWFKVNTKETVTRQLQPKFCEIVRRTERFHKSPLSFLTELLNFHYKK